MRVRMRIPRRIPQHHVTIGPSGGRTPDTPPPTVSLEDPPVPYAVFFPGRAAAAPGAGRAWVGHPAWGLVNQAEGALDRPLARLLLEADEAELSGTSASQLAVPLTSLVARGA